MTVMEPAEARTGYQRLSAGRGGQQEAPSRQYCLKTRRYEDVFPVCHVHPAPGT
jgi:hypothetical protein